MNAIPNPSCQPALMTQILSNPNQDGLARFLQSAGLIFCGIISITLGAKINFATTGPIPIMLSNFAIVIIAALYGRKLGTITVLAYLLTGLAGFPVFTSATEAGPAYLLGSNGGTLIGFIAAAYFIGASIERTKSLSTSSLLVKLIIASLLIYACGLVSLYPYLNHSWSHAIALGVSPFIVFDLGKAVVATLIIKAAYKGSIELYPRTAANEV